MKHIEVDCYITQYHVAEENIETRYVKLVHHLADLFTKPLGKSRVHLFCNKLGMYDNDIHAPI